MNWSTFKYLLTLLLAIPVNLLAITDEPQEVSDTKRWDKRIHLRYEGWERMKPTHVKMQYAGGMGVLSTGVGWDYGKRRQWETDVLLGYLPAKYASDFLLTLTVKQNYIPWSMSFDKHWALEPFYCGMYLTTIAGEEFWKKEPGRYPNRYYNFSTKIRPYIFIGQRNELQSEKQYSTTYLSILRGQYLRAVYHQQSDQPESDHERCTSLFFRCKSATV